MGTLNVSENDKYSINKIEPCWHFASLRLRQSEFASQTWQIGLYAVFQNDRQMWINYCRRNYQVSFNSGQTDSQVPACK